MSITFRGGFVNPRGFRATKPPPQYNPQWNTWSGATLNGFNAATAPSMQLGTERDRPGNTSTWATWSGATLNGFNTTMPTSMIEIQ